MKIEDFQLDSKAAASLREIDSLVAEGLSRARAERIVGQLNDILEGAWLDLLTPLADDGADPEKALLQTFFIAYVHQWSSERMFLAAMVQQANLSYLATQDQNSRED